MCGVRPWWKVASRLPGRWLIRRRIPALSRTWAFATLARPRELGAPQFYADAMVVAYRRAASDVPVEALQPKMTSSAGIPIRHAVGRRSGKDHEASDPKAGESSWIQYEFAQPQTMRSVTIVTKDVD